MTQNLWDAAKAVLKGKFIAIQSYLKKQEKSQINEKEMKKTIAKMNKTKSWFFEKINKIDKPHSSGKKGRRLKATELEMKKKK